MKRKSAVLTAYAMICAGALLLALAYRLFVVENHFAPSGVNGIATMIQYKCGFSIGWFFLIVNIPLCFLAYFFLDRVFAVRTFVFSTVYSVGYLLLGRVDLSGLTYRATGGDAIFPCVIAGIVGGVAYAFCFRAGGSTGGTDVVAKFLEKKNPNLNFFWVIFILNAAVAFASFFVYAAPDPESGRLIFDYKPVCLCMIYCFLSSYVGNLMIKGTKKAYQFTVITPHAEKIAGDIIRELHRGATRVKASGAYSGDGKEMLVCVVGKHQIAECKAILGRYPDTFATIETTTEVIGNFREKK